MIVMSGRKRTRTNSANNCVGYFEILKTPEGSATIWPQRVTSVTDQSGSLQHLFFRSVRTVRETNL